MEWFPIKTTRGKQPFSLRLGRSSIILSGILSRQTSRKYSGFFVGILRKTRPVWPGNRSVPNQIWMTENAESCYVWINLYLIISASFFLMEFVLQSMSNRANKMKCYQVKPKIQMIYLTHQKEKENSDERINEMKMDDKSKANKWMRESEWIDKWKRQNKQKIVKCYRWSPQRQRNGFRKMERLTLPAFFPESQSINGRPN